MGSKTRGQSVAVQITTFSQRGNGVGEFVRRDGQSCSIEIPFTIPKDKVLAEVGRRRAGNYSAKLESITEPSSDRIQPKCVHFTHCGGCRWQNLSYEKQLEEKQRQVEALFKNKALAILPCPKQWWYRNKMEFSFSQNKEGEKFLGLVIDSSKGKVFNLTECHLANSWFEEGVNLVRSWWEKEDLLAYHLFKQTGSLRNLTFREGMNTGDRMVILTVSGNPDYAIKKESLNRLQEVLQPLVPQNGRLSFFLRIVQVKKGMETQYYEMHLAGPDHLLETLQINGKTFTFKVSPQAFFQPNTAQCENLFSKAFSLVNIQPGQEVYDLYCGTGVLAVIAASFGAKVTGIELCPEAVLDARENIKLNHIESATFLQGRVEDKLSSLSKTPDLVMVDPPRAGLDFKAIETLGKLKPKQILYISCNPTTQKSNVEALLQYGYKVQTIQPFDQFPHTVHIENIVVLSQ
jgi:23S rRNA (uracil1939-C5)-methyltransferase